MAQTVISVFPPLHNGMQLQFANILMHVEGDYFAAFNEIEYGWTVDVEEGRGASPYAMGTTTGMHKAHGSISVQLAYREDFLEKVARFSPGGNTIADAVWNAQAQWQVRAAPGLVQPRVLTDELIGCRLVSSGLTGSSGPGMMVVKYALSIMIVKENNRLPLAGLSA